MQKFRIPFFKQLCISILITVCLTTLGLAAGSRSVQAAGGVSVNFTQVPQNMQLYQRNASTNKATVIISGEVTTSGQDEIKVTATHQGTATVEDSASQALSYNGGTAAFSLSIDLVAELTQYEIAIVVRNGSTDETVLTVQNVVAGDVYIINGQSNAAAQRRNGSASADGNQDLYIRSFGHREVNSKNTSNGSTIADSSWNQATGNTGEGAGAVGQWGLHMAKRIVDTYNIPVAVISGAVNASEMSNHLPNNGNHEDINTIYGRLLWRTNRAGVTQNARALLWYQGEGDSKTGLAAAYASKFATLYTSWQQDFIGLENIYLFQIRNLMDTCGDTKTQESIATVREAQRQFADTYSNLQILSTTGIDPQLDGCHFPYENGYEKIGNNLFRLLARDFYASVDTQNIDAPNIAHAYFSNGSNTEVTIVLRDADDALIWNSGAEQDFRLEGSSIIVANGGSVSDNKIILTFPSAGSGATGLTYLGHTGQNPLVANAPWQPSDDPRVGQWVTNSNGIGLLAFYNVPLNQPPTVSITQPADNAVVTQGADVPVSATAADNDGTIAQVDFYADNTLIGTDNSEPYEINWSSPAVGTHLLKAVATDNDGVSTDSALVTLKVNQPPTAAITAPTTGALFNEGTPILITTNATDSDGTVSQIEFYADSTLLCTVTGAPWECTWNNAAVGNYALTIKVTDNDGASTTSAASTVKVNVPPVVSISAPANATVFGVGDNVNMVANASDSNGAVSEVKFFVNNTLLCTDTAAPWECLLPNVTVGNYTLKAVATDNDGASTESAAITVTVSATQPTLTPTVTQTPVPPTTTPTVGPGTPMPPTPTPTLTPTVGPGTPTATPQTPTSALTIPGSSSGAPGSQFIVMGTGFTPNAVLTLYINGATLGTLTTDGAGGFSALLESNTDTAPGQYLLMVNGTSVTFTLDPAQGIVNAANILPRFRLPHLVYMPLMRN